MFKIRVYEVGGSIRDEILGIKSSDKDYAVEAPSYDDMVNFIRNSGGEIYLETPEYFTVRANFPATGPTDFVLCRKDGKYYDGRRPSEVYVGTILDDLARRDFAMNAIAREIGSDILIDPYDGIGDIRLKIIRCVGKPRDRFNEDALRIIRAFRFSVTKDMMISASILPYFKESYIDFIYNAAGPERIRAELYKAFKFNPTRALNLMYSYFPALIPLMAKCGIWLKPTVER